MSSHKSLTITFIIHVDIKTVKADLFLQYRELQKQLRVINRKITSSSIIQVTLFSSSQFNADSIQFDNTVVSMLQTSIIKLIRFSQKQFYRRQRFSTIQFYCHPIVSVQSNH